MTASLLAVFAGGVNAADAGKGQAVADAQCADCHEASEWQGESAEALATRIKDVAVGKTKHKSKIKLSDEEMRDVAAYWAAAQ